MTVLREKLNARATQSDKKIQVLNFGFYDRVEPVFVEIMCLLSDFNVKGEGNLPRKGDFILISNHPSSRDPLHLIALMSLLRKRRVAFGGKKELFDIKILGRFLEKTHQFSVDRQGVKESVATSSSLLEEIELRAANGMIIGLFPEATRTRGEELGPFHRGAALAAIMADISVEPSGIAYSETGLRAILRQTIKEVRKCGPLGVVTGFLRGVGLMRTVYITFGQPISSCGRSSRDFNAELERTVAALFEESRARARA